ncbi:LPXTG cell wall anchor domain-containing protein [Fructilactobacillus vespulae]|uniref:mucin-binding protein n=1 Tax=Fructilactobacillus vespulae TaxID=1249630 RepID=UPI0039B4C6EA
MRKVKKNWVVVSLAVFGLMGGMATSYLESNSVKADTVTVENQSNSSAAENKSSAATSSAAESKSSAATSSAAESESSAATSSAAESESSAATSSAAENKSSAATSSAAESKSSAATSSAAESKSSAATSSASESKSSAATSSESENKSEKTMALTDRVGNDENQHNVPAGDKVTVNPKVPDLFKNDSMLSGFYAYGRIFENTNHEQQMLALARQTGNDPFGHQTIAGRTIVVFTYGNRITGRQYIDAGDSKVSLVDGTDSNNKGKTLTGDDLNNKTWISNNSPKDSDINGANYELNHMYQNPNDLNYDSSYGTTKLISISFGSNVINATAVDANYYYAKLQNGQLVKTKERIPERKGKPEDSDAKTTLLINGATGNLYPDQFEVTSDKIPGYTLKKELTEVSGSNTKSLSESGSGSQLRQTVQGQFTAYTVDRYYISRADGNRREYSMVMDANNPFDRAVMKAYLGNDNFPKEAVMRTKVLNNGDSKSVIWWHMTNEAGQYINNGLAQSDEGSNQVKVSNLKNKNKDAAVAGNNPEATYTIPGTLYFYLKNGDLISDTQPQTGLEQVTSTLYKNSLGKYTLNAKDAAGNDNIQIVIPNYLSSSMNNRMDQATFSPIKGNGKQIAFVDSLGFVGYPSGVNFYYEANPQMATVSLEKTDDGSKSNGVKLHDSYDNPQAGQSNSALQGVTGEIIGAGENGGSNSWSRIQTSLTGYTYKGYLINGKLVQVHSQIKGQESNLVFPDEVNTSKYNETENTTLNNGKISDNEPDKIVLLYQANDQRAHVDYIDDDTNTTVKTDHINGKTDEQTNKNTKASIDELIAKGYVLVPNRDTTNGKNIKLGNDGVDKKYEVHFKHKQSPLPKVDSQKTINQEIKYVDESGTKINTSATDSVEYNRSGYYDEVTKQNVYTSNWTAKDGKNTFSEKKSPVVTGYYLKYKNQTVISLKTVTENDSDDNETVYYEKVGQLVPVDPTGNPLQPGKNYPNDPNNPDKITDPKVPTIPGKIPLDPRDNKTPLKPGTNYPIDPNKPGDNTNIVYVNTNQHITVSYVDKDTNDLLHKEKLTGKPGDKSNYTTSEEIKNLEKQGYKVVNDGYPKDGASFGKDDKDQNYTVTLEQVHVKVSHDDPKNPGTNVPGYPDINYPDGVKKDDLNRTITQTVHYVDKATGKEVHGTAVQTVTFTRDADVNLVTKEVTYTPWVSSHPSFNEVKSPVVDGYYLVDKNQSVLAAKQVTENSVNDDETVYYEKVGQLVPVDPTGNPLQPGKNYPNDPNNPDKITDPKVPTIPGKTPLGPKGDPIEPGTNYPVNPNKPGDNTNIVYVNTDQHINVSYVDKDTNDLLHKEKLTGKPGDKSNYTTSEEIKNLEKQGYKVVNDGYPKDGASFGKDDKDQNYTVTLEQVHVKVPHDDPKNPGTNVPGHPDINYPDGVKKDDLNRTITQTVHYVDKATGKEVHGTVVQNVTFTRDADVNLVTKEVTYTPWVSSHPSFNEVKSPVVDGYYLVDKNQSVLAAKQVTENSVNDDETVYYEKVGQLVPVDPTGNPLQPGKNYPNDPNNPDKITDPKVPTIPGKTPLGPKGDPIEPGTNYPVNPNKPGDNTNIVYVNTDQHINVSYVDKDTNDLLHKEKLTGKPGDKSNYTTSEEIKNLEKQGYKVVNDGYPKDGASFGKDDKDQNYTVTLEQVHVKVPHDDPKNPGTNVPGHPDINYPDGIKKDDLNRTITQTVHYVDKATGKEVHGTVVQNVTFTRDADVNLVTKEVTYTPWVSSHPSFNEVKSPVVDGYYLVDKNQSVLAAKQVTENSVNDDETVYYEKVGQLVPVDPTGNPLQPGKNYPNDPNNPDKITDPKVPTIPGKTPLNPKGDPIEPGTNYPVNPNKPGDNTNIVYVNTDQHINVSYVDKDTNDLLHKEKLTGKPGDKSNYTTSEEIKNLEKQGYKVVNDGYPKDGASFGKDDKDQNYTVTLEQVHVKVPHDDPKNPGTNVPGHPDINYPDGVKKDDLNRTITQTVHYVDKATGKEVHGTVVQNVTFTRDADVNLVTKEVTYTPWVSSHPSFNEVKSPVVDGYYLVDKNQSVLAAKQVTENSVNDDETVYYSKMGNLIPVDPNGNEIPGVDHPKYPNDPTNPSEPGNPVIPDIPGMIPLDPITNKPLKPGDPYPVDPNHPGENIRIKYVVDKPVTSGNQDKHDNADNYQGKTVSDNNGKASGNNNSANQQKLPQTGETNSNSVLSLIGISLVSMFGLVGLGKRRKNEK